MAIDKISPVIDQPTEVTQNTTLEVTVSSNADLQADASSEDSYTPLVDQIELSSEALVQLEKAQLLEASRRAQEIEQQKQNSLADEEDQAAQNQANNQRLSVII
ncbi:MAG: hypothetical protein IT292_08370 [Deltaproteobacteria bacterium]|nr:hypothetical protein [Deltaproteobacteria bacterium]